MSVESRLRAASSELEAAVSQRAVPEFSDSSKSRALAGLVVGVVAVAALVLPFLFLDVRAPIGSPAEDSPRFTPAGETTTAEGLLLRRSSPAPMTGPIEVIDPTEARERVIDGLELDPGPFGSEYPLIPVSDPEALRSWFMPVVPDHPSQWNWRVVGQVAGFDMPVVVAANEIETVVCAGLQSGVMSCVGEGFQALSTEEFSPAVWLVPERTAVVAFAEHDNSGWQVPSGGAVAFPRSHLSSSATLTAHDLQGRTIGQVEFGQLVEANEQFDQLPQPPTVDLVRVLLERQLPTIWDTDIIESHPAAEAILGISTTLTVRFTHVDASESFAILVSDGVRGVAIWSQDPAALGQAFADDPVAQDHGNFQTADSGERLIVTRGVTVQEIVERWNSALNR